MKVSQKGFAAPLLIGLIAILLIGGVAYMYVQKEPASQTASDQTKGTDNSWLDSTNPPKPAQTETQQPQTQVVAPSKVDTLNKLLTDNPKETKAVLTAWNAAEKLSIDNGIRASVAYSRSLAEKYFGITNGNSYAGVCTNINGLLGTTNELSNLSGSVVCKDSSTSWAISAQLTNSTPQYQCADNLGSFIIRSSPITTTKCN